MIPFFALIGLVTVISIIVNLQINRHSLFNKIIGTVILTFACIFSCLAILYPLYFGSYENLIITFVAAFILLIGIYAVSGLVVNRRRLKNVVYVSAEGSDVTSDYGKAKELIKPVQLKPAQAPKTKRKGQASQNNRKVPVVKREKQLDRYGLNDAAATEKEGATLSGIIRPDRPSFDGDFNRAVPRMMMKDLGMELETGTIEEAIVTEAEKIDGSVSFKDVDTEPQVQTEITAMDAEQTISVEPTTEEDIEPQAEPEDSDMDAEQMIGYESAAEEEEKDAEHQADTETSGIESERVEYTGEEDVEPQTQTENSDKEAEQMVSARYETDKAIDQDQAEDSQMVSFESATEEDEEDAEHQADTEASDIDIEQMVGVQYATDEAIEPQAQAEDSDMGAEQVVSVLTVEDKYSRLITKALELKNQRQYLNAIFILQSVYDNMDETIRKQADMQLMECFILSGQFHEGQKKWFDILNKKYDFEPDEKAKLKAMMVQLNARQL